MPLKETKDCVVIRTIKVKDNSLVVKALFSDDTVRSFAAGKISKTKANILLSHLSFVSCSLVHTKYSSLAQASDFEEILPLKNIRTNTAKNLLWLFISDVLDKTLKDGAEEEGFYQWIRSEAVLLDNLSDGYANFHLLFMIRLCEKLGYGLTRESFAPFAAGLPYPDKALALIEEPYESALLYPLSGKERSAFLEACLEYLSSKSESKIVCPSLGVLSSLF